MSVEHRGPWTVLSTQKIFQNEFMTIRQDKVKQPDGSPAQYATAQLTPGVGVIALDHEENIVLVKQYRYAAQKESLEIVCGAIEDDEDPIEAARRELEEEAKLTSSDLLKLTQIDLDTSIINCPMHLYIARNLCHKERNADATEALQITKLPLHDAVSLVRIGKITHAASCVGILLASFLEGKLQ